MTEQGKILDMLAEGKINAEEAERLLEALLAHESNHSQTPDAGADPLDEEGGAQPEGDEAERLGPGPGVKLGIGAYVSPDVRVPAGSVIGTGACINAGVVIESGDQHWHGGVYRGKGSSPERLQGCPRREYWRGCSHRKGCQGWNWSSCRRRRNDS